MCDKMYFKGSAVTNRAFLFVSILSIIMFIDDKTAGI